MAERKSVIFEDAQLIFKNFSGAETQYNAKGQRNFAVLLDQETADDLVKQGWNVRTLKAKEEGEPDAFYLPVAVRFDNIPPQVCIITSRGKENLPEDMVEMLDYANMKMVDLICNGSDWTVNGKSGTKAYLRRIFVTIEEDYLEQKYANMGNDELQEKYIHQTED